MENNSRKFGYYLEANAGCSSTEKNESLEQFVFARDIYFDLAGNVERTNLKKLLSLLHPGDTVYFYSLDGLFKNSSSTKQLLQLFKEHAINIRILDLPSTLLDVDYLYSEEKTYTEIVLDFIIDMVTKAVNRENLANRMRQNIGFNEARKNGVKLGRKAKPLPPSFETDYNDWKSGKCTAASIYRKYGWSNPCFYRRVKQYEMSISA